MSEGLRSGEEQHGSLGACSVILGWVYCPLCDMRAGVLCDVTEEPMSLLAGGTCHFSQL